MEYVGELNESQAQAISIGMKGVNAATSIAGIAKWSEAFTTNPALGWVKVGIQALDTIGGVVQGVQKLKTLRTDIQSDREAHEAQFKISQINLAIKEIEMEISRIGYRKAYDQLMSQKANISDPQTVKNLAIGASVLGFLLLMTS